MILTKKPKARFLVRIRDLKYKKWTSLRVYEIDGNVSLEDFKKRVKSLIDD